ncbi:MAG: acetyltransferase [Bacteroidaceae bacterium]|nr:acetyltransferase [Bacteroidaceae bacterium]
MVSPIVIVGAGGFGREVASLLKRINRQSPTWELLGFYDDDTRTKPRGSRNEYGDILGTVDDLNQVTTPVAAILAIGFPNMLKSVKDRLTNPLISFPNIIAPEASILDPENYQMGQGNILSSFASISCNVRLGNFNVINNRTSFGHDAVVGDFNTFMTACRISGGTVIGNQNRFGVGAIVIPGVKIGTGVTVSPGSVIMRKPKDNSTYIGNPAKQFKI